MASYNRILLVGNVTKDPALSYLPSQTPVCEFSIATNRKWKDKDGQQREEVCFVDCRAYGKTAETLNQYVKKGSLLLVEGRLTLDTWEKDGQKHSKHRVTVENFQFLGGKDDARPAQEAPRKPAPKHAPPPAFDSDPTFPSEDIPF